MSPVARPFDPREPGGPIRVLKRALLAVDAPFVDEIVADVVLIALMLLVLPLAAVVFVATSLLFYAVLMLLGTPGGTLGAALGLTWFGGSLALIGWLCVLAWRHVGFIGVLTGLSSVADEAEPAPAVTMNVRDPNADSDTVLTRVAAADARLAGSTRDTQGDDQTYQ
jgi:hypothetical protein